MDPTQLAYGHSIQELSLSGTDAMFLVECQLARPPAAEGELVLRALKAPCGLNRLSQLVRPGHRVAVVVSDVTRPCPTPRLLPPLLSELHAGGVDKRDIRITFALGSHRCLTPKEKARQVGDVVYGTVCCDDSGGGPFVQVGHTSRGTPVRVFAPVVVADWRVYVGNIEYHSFAGYTGGAKALLPGVCSEETILANHSWMAQDSATAGRIEGNPVREDIEEAATFVGPSFLLNVVLDGEKRVVAATAGDVTQAHRLGAQRVDELYRVPFAQHADIVLASAGGWPKDINLYQAHKALENAAHAVQDKGIIVLVAECGEGFGHLRFSEWMTRGDPPHELLRRIRERFVLGGHKAASIAKIRGRGVRVFLVSSLDAATVRAMDWMPFDSAQQALAAARNEMGLNAVVAVMPHAGSTLPVPTPR